MDNLAVLALVVPQREALTCTGSTVAPIAPEMSKRAPSHSTRTRVTAKASPAIELVVRRGALRRFDRFTQRAVDLSMKVTWDQRRDERRTSSREVDRDDRKTERRQKPPFTWELADFVIVGKLPAPRPDAKATKTR